MPFSLPTTASIAARFRSKKSTYTINTPDPTFYCVYLGNVITVIAKGDAAVTKPLALIWKTYEAHSRADMPMKLTITRSGLKAETKAQGLTEYWAHRTTFCSAPASHPRVFVWVYKHDGKKMKHELRCHAVLCKKVAEPTIMTDRLTDALQTALAEYRREKAAQEQARERSGSLPRRSVTLATGSKNFRPPHSQTSRPGAPKLLSIDEDTEDEMEEVVHNASAQLQSICDEMSSVMVASTSVSITTSPSDGDDCEEQCELEDEELVIAIPLRGSTSSSTASNGSGTKDKDSLSDESGYHEKTSYEENGRGKRKIMEEEEGDMIVMSF